MATPTITRELLLQKIVEVIDNLPDAKLQQAWEQVASWDTPLSEQAEAASLHSSAGDNEILEFEVEPYPNAPKQFVRIPIRLEKPAGHAIMEVGESTYGPSEYAQRIQANIEWWNQNFDKICNNPSLYDSYVAISDGLVFATHSYLDAYNKALAVHTDGVPYIFFLKSPDNSTNHAN